MPADLQHARCGMSEGRGRLHVKAFLGVGLALAVLTGCTDPETYLPGTREPLRDGVALAPATDDADVTRAITLPQPTTVTAWTHRAGTPTHAIGHAAFGAAPQQLWSLGIGEGNNRRSRITADPVAAEGRIYVMDSQSKVTAVSEAGTAMWSRSLVPAGERARDASGGGLAYADGTLYVTTGFGELHAIDAFSGAIEWIQDLDASAAAAPTVDRDLIYVVASNSRAWAVARSDGRVRWTLPGTPSDSGFVGGAAPAVTDKLAIFPFESGELVATLKRGGVPVWASAVSGDRDGRAYTAVSDITADPVIVGDRIYTGTPAGRLVALHLRSGERIWTATEGAMGPVWPAGDSVFAINDQSELVRIDAATGQRVWGTELAYFEANRIRRRKAIVAHYGPVLAGGRLWVGSGDEVLRGFDPESGEARIDLPVRGGVATRPVVVNGVMYVVSGRGQLHAFR